MSSVNISLQSFLSCNETAKLGSASAEGWYNTTAESQSKARYSPIKDQGPQRSDRGRASAQRETTNVFVTQGFLNYFDNFLLFKCIQSMKTLEA